MPGGPIDPENVLAAILAGATPSSDRIVVLENGSPVTKALAFVGGAWVLDTNGDHLISQGTFDEVARATSCANGLLIIGDERKQLASVGGFAVIAAP